MTIEIIVLGSLIGILLYIIQKPIIKWNKQRKQEWCDRKVMYDPEYNMWFSEHPFHECSLCEDKD